MRAKALRWAGGLLLGVSLASGCAQDREKALVGKWKTSETAPLTMAFKLKQHAPSGVNPTGAAFALAATAIELRADKSFTLAMAGNVMEGTWTFDKTSGDVSLNITRSASPVGALGLAPSPGKPETWIAKLDKDNRHLSVFPGSKETQAFVQREGGVFKDGILLKKEGQP